MPDRLTTLRDLSRPAHLRRGPDLFELRVLERDLVRRIAGLDARVDALLDFAGHAPTDAQVAAVDVLCAAIAELEELLAQARREAARHVERRRSRRERPRRWA